MSNTPAPDWSEIPEPQDDGACAHLAGMKLPQGLSLPATDGRMVDLSGLFGRTVVYVYPRTGAPGKAVPEGWDAIPGARGCTPQSCAFRDHFKELSELGVDQLFGLSTQDTAYQKEAETRLHLPFPLLSDEGLELAKALNLPTFDFGDATMIKRLTLIIEDGTIRDVIYPVFPPDKNAEAVIDWLKAAS
jgi:peroxiredoxin